MHAKPLPLKFTTEKLNSILIQDTRIVAAYLLGSIVGGHLHAQSDAAIDSAMHVIASQKLVTPLSYRT